MDSGNETSSKNFSKPDGAANETENAASQESNENNSEKNSSNNNFDSMLQMIQMLNLMKGTQQPNTTPEQKNEKPAVDEDITPADLYAVQAVEPLSTPFDEKLQTPALKALKAAIPYLEPQQQKNIGLFTKLFEFQQLINLYNNEGSYTMQNQTTYANNKTAILHAMRPFVAKEKQPMIDILVKIIDIKELYEKIK